MKRDFILTTRCQAASALSCVALSLLACAQAGAQVAPPQAQGPGGVRVGGAGGGVQGVRSGAEADWMLQLKSGQLSPEEAWNRGLLTPTNTARVIWSQEIVGEKNKPLRQKLAGLLAERAPEVLGPKSATDSKLKQLAGDYFREQQDERAVGFFEAALEELLQERKAQQKSQTAGDLTRARGGEVTWVQPLIGLATIYREQGQYDKAIKMWLRSEEFSAYPPMRAEWRIESAWLYEQVGDEKKAEALYTQVPQFGFEWATQAALWGLARLLIRNDRHKEVRDLLASSLVSINKDHRQVAASSLMAISYYRTGDFREAKQWSEKTLAEYEALEVRKPRMGLDVALNDASQCLWWAQEWEKRPFVCWPPELQFSGTLKQPALSFNVRSFRNIPLTIVVDNPRIKAVAIEDWQDAEDNFCADKTIAVEVLPTAEPKEFEATITVSSSRFPNFKERVKVRVGASKTTLSRSTL